MLPKIHQVNTKNSLDKTPFKEGSIYICIEDHNIYYDPVGKENRICLTSSKEELDLVIDGTTKDDILAVNANIDSAVSCSILEDVVIASSTESQVTNTIIDDILVVC